MVFLDLSSSITKSSEIFFLEKFSNVCIINLMLLRPFMLIGKHEDFS